MSAKVIYALSHVVNIYNCDKNLCTVAYKALDSFVVRPNSRKKRFCSGFCADGEVLFSVSSYTFY